VHALTHEDTRRRKNEKGPKTVMDYDDDYNSNSNSNNNNNNNNFESPAKSGRREAGEGLG